MKLPAALQTMLAPLQARWLSLAAREQKLLRVAAVLIGLLLVWWLLLAPPLATLRSAEEQRRSLDAQTQTMNNLQAQALALQAQPKIDREEALRALASSVKQRLGNSAQLSVAGDRATLTLRNTPADALAQWLAQARVTARATPSEARLTRASAAAPVPAPVAALASVNVGNLAAPGGNANTGSAPPPPGMAATAAATAQPAPVQAALASAAAAWDGTLVMRFPEQ